MSAAAAAAAAFPSWVMLEPVVFRRDRESSFPDESEAPIRATGVTTWDAPFGVAFSLAEPPLISSLYAHLPDFPRKQFPLHILATHRHLALLRVGTYLDEGLVQDFFIFDASATDNHSSLRLLPACTEPDMDYSRPDGSLPPDLTGRPSPDNKRQLLTVTSLGLLCRGEHEFAVAQLELYKLSHSKVFADIYLLLKSESDGPGSTARWSSLRVPVLHSDNNSGYNSNDDLWQLCLWQTNAVVPVGHWLCWVDYYRGILFCDVFGDPTPTVSFLRFPLDSFPDTYTRNRACSWLYRSVSAVDDGRALKFVDIARNDGIGYGALRPGAGYTITCHTLMLDTTTAWNKEALSGAVWSKDFTATSGDLWAANPPDRLPRHILMFPQVDMDRPHVVHFLATEFEYAMKKMWLVAIDMNTRIVESVSQYTNGLNDVGTEGEYLTYERSICPMPFLACEFSKYLRLPRPRQAWFSAEDGIFYKCKDTSDTESWPFDSICSELL